MCPAQGRQGTRSVILVHTALQKYLPFLNIPTICNITNCIIFLPFDLHNVQYLMGQYLVDPSLAAVTAASLVGYVSTIFAHFDPNIFAHSSG